MLSVRISVRWAPVGWRRRINGMVVSGCLLMLSGVLLASIPIIVGCRWRVLRLAVVTGVCSGRLVFFAILDPAIGVCLRSGTACAVIEVVGVPTVASIFAVLRG